MHSCYLINTWRSLQFLFLFCLISTILAISSPFSNTHTIWYCKFRVSLDFATVWWIFIHCLLPSTAIFLLWCPWLSSMPVSVEYSTHKRFSTLCYLLPVMLVMMYSELCTNHSVTYWTFQQKCLSYQVKLPCFLTHPKFFPMYLDPLLNYTATFPSRMCISVNVEMCNAHWPVQMPVPSPS